MAYGEGTYGEGVYGEEGLSAPFTGSGTLSVTTSVVAVVTAAFVGAGALSVVAIPDQTPAPFGGSGALSVTTQIVGNSETAASFGGYGGLTVATVKVGQLTASFGGSGALSVAAVAVETHAGDTSNRDDGIDIDGTAIVEWQPAVVATPARYTNLLAMDTARAITLNGIGPAGQPLITTQDVRVQRSRDRILIGGADFTYFRGVKTPTPDYRLIKPLLWGSGQLVLPQINPQYERLGPSATLAALKQIKDGAQVVVQRVDASNNVVATDYVGFIDAINTSGRALTLTLGGHASGRASRDDVPPPVFRHKHDIAWQILNYLRTLNLHAAKDTEIGIPLYDRGATDGLSHINELVALATTTDGTQHDVMPDDNRFFDVTTTDRETIHATVYFDDALATQQLDRAFSEEPNIVYATGRTWRGEVVNGAVAPGLVQGPPPDWAGTTLQNGSTGDQVTLVNQQLTIGGFLNYDDLDSEAIYGDPTEDAVVLFQMRAGLATVAAAGGFLGKVNEPTWRALWDLDVLGFSLDRARIEPMAQRDYTRKWNLSANGGKLSRNPDWKPHRIKTAVTKDLGSGFTRHRIRRFAHQALAPLDVSNWQGTLNLTSAVIAGEHTPGDPITSDDVMPHRALRPGMNIWAPLFDGGTLFHISGADVSNDGWNVSLILDTQARDTMAAWESIARNRETRSNPARAWSGQVRASSVRHDTIADWTDICGNLSHKRALADEKWTEVVIPAGQEGVIQRIDMQLQTADEFAVILSQRKIGLNRLNSQVPTPLTTPAGDPQTHLITLTGSPTGGTFTLTGNSNETATIAYNASAATVQTAVRSLAGEFSDATVSGSSGGPWTVTMHGGSSDIDAGDNNLTGGSSPSISVTSQAASAGDTTPWYEQEGIRAWLDDRGVLEAWGTPEQPCGYDPGLKTDGNGPTAQPITGEFSETAGLNYVCAHPGRLYLYVWTWADNFLLPGRILTQQITSGA